MIQTQIRTVPHPGGSQVGYRMPHLHDRARPTLVTINSFSTYADLFKLQFEDAQLAGMANLKLMNVLRIDKAFVMGTAQE